MPRFHVPDPLQSDARIALPAGAARHVQVLRLQPGAEITLFDGQGGEYTALVERMGRSDVQVQVGAHTATEREAVRAVHLAVGMPANDRMDWLVEKATELGVASIQPLVTERTVLRLSGERADKKRLHWEAIAIAACEQCGRNRVPRVHPVQALPDWLARSDWADDFDGVMRRVLSLRATAAPRKGPAIGSEVPAWIVGGPEGGLAEREENMLITADFAPMSLGSRVLRVETAMLAALAYLSIQ
ncbi:MAG: 16S rRNA (uracil(1498)-N(3))-methyltransferase [Burkholderiaceae bacterium]